MLKNKESTAFVLTIAMVLSLVCASLVSIAAVKLKPIQDQNAAREKKINILIAAGIYKPGADIDMTFDNNIIAQAIDLHSGEPTDQVNAKTFDAIKAAKDPAFGEALVNDPAKIGYLSKYAVIYLLKKGEKVKRIILPIRGYGLWGTMYGFLALDADGDTIKGITFYDQKETPGLGAQILNPKWQKTWDNKKIFDTDGKPAIKLVKTKSSDAKKAVHEIDSLAGATLTSRGVEKMINFWMGEKGYGIYLEKIKNR